MSVVNGKELRSRMKDMGITQKELSKEVGVSQTTIGDWLRRGRHIKTFQSQRIVDALRRLSGESSQNSVDFIADKELCRDLGIDIDPRDSLIIDGAVALFKAGWSASDAIQIVGASADAFEARIRELIGGAA